MALKIDLDLEKGIIREVRSSGRLLTTMAELHLAVGLLYEDLMRMEPKAAAVFRDTLIRSFSDPASPVWATGENAYIRHCAKITIDEDLIRKAREQKGEA